MIEILDIGKIVNTHGVKGEVKVMPFTDDQERYSDLKWVYTEKDNKLEKLYIQSVKYLKQMVIVRFKGIDDMTAAEALKGAVLKVDRENAVKLPKDSFFICDIIGLNVQDDAGKSLGILKDVIKTGSNDVYVVKGEDQKEILVPALKSVVKEISIEDKRIVVSLPEGLIEDEI